MIPLLIFAAAAALTHAPRSGARLPAPTNAPIVAAMERVALPPVKRPIDVTVDALGARILLRSADAAVLAARLRMSPPALCPTVESGKGIVILRCGSTTRIDAELSSERGRAFLDLRVLRGLPYRGPDQALPVFYDPRALGLGDGCPGKTPAVRGECALRDQQAAQAALQFRLALDTPQFVLAGLRLGDLALAAGDVSAALDWYLRAGAVGPFGRLAVARLCELTGSCLEKAGTLAFEDAGLPEPIRSEMNLRAARVDLFMARVPSAIRRLAALLTDTSSPAFCDKVGQRFCRRLILEVLERSDKQTALPALEVYLSLPARTTGPMALELARAAAESAALLGAPVFGGNLLAAVFMSVGPDEMRDYLLRTTELYCEGKDQARASVVLEYAETRFPRRALAGARWAAVRALAGNDDVSPGMASAESARMEALATGVARDVASAFGILARARAAHP